MLMQALKCTRCGHEWYPRQFTDQGRPVEPLRCPGPRCGSPYWKTPRLSKTQKAELVRKRTQAYWRERSAEDG